MSSKGAQFLHLACQWRGSPPCPMLITHWLSDYETNKQARNQLGTPGWRSVFWEWSNLFKLCTILLKKVQHIFPRGEKIF